MEINEHLEDLALKDADLRRQALADILDQEGLAYIRQTAEPDFKNPRGIVNYILSPWNDAPGILFGAHYDAVPGSCGANDNGAALCILIALAKKLKKKNIPARFAFFDGEENGNAGSRLYVSQLDRQKVTGYVNLDLCGFGDTLAVYGKGHEKKPVFASFCSKELLARHSGQLVKYIPPGDEASFSSIHLPSITLCVIPRWDIQYLNALATYKDGFLGRPPEFEMMMGQMEIITTMHGGYRDSLEYIEPEAMMQVYDYLLDALLSPAPAKKWLGLF